MRTIDVRLLVRDDTPTHVVLEQLLTGVLRVHAVIQLVADPRPGSEVPADRRAHVPVPPVHRNPRSDAHHVEAHRWLGEPLRPARYRSDRPHPEEYA